MICPVCQTSCVDFQCKNCGTNLIPMAALVRKSAELYNEGLQYARENRLEHARCALKKAIRYNAENVEALNLLGVVYTRTGEIGEAIQLWEQSRKIDGNEFSNPAIEYLKKASRSASKASLMKEAIRLYNQALVSLEDGQMDSALMHLKKAVSISENFIKAREVLALCCLKNHQFSKAEDLIRSAIEIDAEDPSLPHLRKLYQQEKEAWENSREGRAVLEKTEAQQAEQENVQDSKEEDAPADPVIPGISRKKTSISFKALLKQNGVMVQFMLFFTGLLIGLLFTILM